MASAGLRPLDAAEAAETQQPCSTDRYSNSVSMAAARATALGGFARGQLYPSIENINYTNICVTDCKFCAFYRRPGHAEGYVLSNEDIGRKIDEAKAIGAVQILMQGGHNPYLRLDYYTDPSRAHQVKPRDPCARLLGVGTGYHIPD